MSKEDIIAIIKAIDEQLKKNNEALNFYVGKVGDSNVLTLNMLTRDLVIIKKTWVDMLLCEYGVYYTG